MSKLTDDVARFRRLLPEVHLPPDLEHRVVDQLEEITRLEGDITARIHIEQMLRYIDWVVSLPWSIRTTDRLDLIAAKQILDKHHYGLQPVKDRLLEYLAVLQLNAKRWQENQSTKVEGANGEIAVDAHIAVAVLARRAPILCFVGLVGTGKTTLAKSIAESMGRRFVRIPFGGMSDALELRGQSRVRPDAEIGMIMKGLRFAGSKNPVILLDEIDRVAESARGDIMGVLVELLDPEQNAAFRDHYVDEPFDLSECLFIATANNTTHIATAVLDRLEPIQMPSYTDEEKITIIKTYVLPALMRESGLTNDNLSFDDDVWPSVVRPLGYDAGIRSLERLINGICRKVARLIVEGNTSGIHITSQNVKEYLPQY